MDKIYGSRMDENTVSDWANGKYQIEKTKVDIELRKELMAERRKNSTQLRKLQKDPVRNKKEIDELKKLVDKDIDKISWLKRIIDASSKYTSIKDYLKNKKKLNRHLLNK
jgi:hypothetical protein